MKTEKTNPKEFHPFENVLVRIGGEWIVDIYSHYSIQSARHVCIGHYVYEDKNILPYKGNKSLIGESFDPNICDIEEGEWIVVFESKERFMTGYMCLRQYQGLHINQHSVLTKNNHQSWEYFIPLSKFDPNDIGASLKEALTVRDGIIILANL